MPNTKESNINPTSNIQHPTSNEIAISLKNVSKYYKLYNNPKDRLKEALNRKGKTYHKKFYATKNLNLEIKKGEIIGIVGKNGSGKSTLLKLITGVLQPDEGSISVNGKISALLELGSGFNPEFTGMQNIFFYGAILGFSKEEMNGKVDEILAFADIGDFIHQPLKTYSSGMKSRLGFAVAVHIDPEILILDEVLAVGDVLFKRKCYAKMEEFFKGGKTIIYVSHDANSVRELCSRAIFLEHGKIILDNNAKTVTTFYEKYIFATDENKKNILFEAENLHRLSVTLGITESKTNLNNNSEKRNPSTQNLNNKQLKAFLIPEFISKNKVEYKNCNVTISDIKLVQNDGEKVNVLVQGETYKYTYKVTFGISVSHVSFGMQIKNTKGVAISGSSLAKFEKQLSFVEKDSTYEVIWNFKCNLTPGTYFLNAGSSGLVNGAHIYLHRLIDVLCFKVISRYPHRYGGVVSLEQYPIINKIS